MSGDDEPTRRADQADDGFFDISSLQTALTDPLYGYLVLLALSLGLSPLEAPVRYPILWTLAAVLGGAAYLLGGETDRQRPSLGQLLGGMGFGALISLPVVVLLAPALALTAKQLFPQFDAIALYLTLAFALPMAESLLFRGTIQAVHGFRTAGITGGVWSVLLFMPHLTFAENLVVGIGMFALSFAYAYVRDRNGFTAAWLCQIVANVLLLFLPRFA